jgi:hypothetical protein
VLALALLTGALLVFEFAVLAEASLRSGEELTDRCRACFRTDRTHAASVDQTLQLSDPGRLVGCGRQQPRSAEQCPPGAWALGAT